MPQPPQLQLNGFLAQKSVFKKHLMERIINLFEYTSNLIKGGAQPPGQPGQLSLDTALGSGEQGGGAQPGESRGWGVCVFQAPRLHLPSRPAHCTSARKSPSCLLPLQGSK